MHLAFDIFQGIGITVAVGIRPFLPALVVGALAAGRVEIHFNGTDYSFLQSAPFLIAVGVAAVALWLAERSLAGRTQAAPARSSATGRAGSSVIAPGRAWSRNATVGIGAVGGIVLGALFFAGALARGHYIAWPGLVGGVICAAVAIAASVPLLARVSTRLGGGDASALPLYAEGAAVLIAALSVLAPPVGLIAFVLVGWLLMAGRRREGQKYAGLRILR